MAERRLGLALALALAATATMASGAAAGDGFGPTEFLRRAPYGHDIGLGSMATWRDNIAVGWREGFYTQYLRYSTDGGETFGPRIAIGPTSADPYLTLDICRGFVVALAGPSADLELDMRSLDGTVSGRRDIFAEHSIARSPLIVCGTDRVATLFYDDVGPAKPLRLGIEGLFEPLPAYQFELGTIPSQQGIAMAATDSWVFTAWGKDGRVRFKRFAIGSDIDRTVTALPTVTLFHRSTTDCCNIALGAHGRHLVLAYTHENDVRLRISHDHGKTFGPETTVVDESGSDPLVAAPVTVDLRGRKILVEVMQRDTSLGQGDPMAWQQWGMFSKDGGSSWTSTPDHRGGLQVGGFVRANGRTMIAEAWDTRWFDDVAPASGKEWIKFHVGTP